MKKYKKFLTSGILAAAMATSTLAIPANHVKAYAATPAPTPADVKIGDVVSVKGVPSVGKIDTEIVLPKATTSAWANPTSSTVAISIKQPNGAEVAADKITTTADNYKFTPDRVGRYVVTYTATNASGVVTTSESYSILVSADTYSMTFASNSSVVLPGYVDTLATRFDGGIIPNVSLPHPDVYNEKGVLVYTNGAYNPAFDEADAEEKLGLTTQEIEYYKNCEVRVVVKTDNYEYSSAAGSLTKDAAGNYVFKPEEGTNVISYSYYKVGSALALQTQTKTIIGSNTYNHNEIQIGYTIPNAPTTASLNQRTSLPYASAYNKNDANSTLNVYTDVKVVLKGSNTPVTVHEDADGLYFIPEVEDGDYQITYNVTDYYGNKGEEYKWTINDVQDDTAPTLYVVRGYDYAKVASKTVDLHEAKYLVPTKVGRNTGTMTLPAIYAEDNVADFSNMTFTRTISSTVLSSTINLQTNAYHPYSPVDADDTKTSYTQAEMAAREVSLDISDEEKFPAGDYTLTYRISDGNMSSSWVATFTIEETFTDATAPVVNYADNFPSVVFADQVVKFDKPTVTDNAATIVDVRYYVEFGAKTKIYEINLDSEDSSKYSFDMSTKIEGQNNKTIYKLAEENNGELQVVAYATDAHGNTQAYTKTIYVNRLNDPAAPVANRATGTDVSSNTYKQYSTVKADGVVFTDEDRNLMIVVTVRDEDGNKVTGYKALGAIDKVENEVKDGGGNVIGYTYTYTHPGISFTANLAQSYTVTYTAIDSSNNSSSVTTVLPVLIDQESPIITGVVNNKTYEMELGTRLDLGLATVFDNVDSDLVAKVTCVENPEYITDSLFVPLQVNKEGYTIKYTAEDLEGNEAEEITVYVKVVDKTKPILTVNNGMGYEKDRKEFTTKAKDFGKVYIPDFSSEDDYHGFGIGSGALNLGTTDKVVIDGPDGKQYTVGNAQSKYAITYENGSYCFVPTVKGTYTVTYSATDLSGNAADNQVIKILVGETIKPTVSYSATIAPKLNLSDAKLVIDTTKIVITDNILPEEGKEFVYNTITLNEKNSGTAVTYETSGDNDQIRTYNFEKEGTYTLTITAKDAAGNLGTYTTDIVVVGENNKETYTNETTGVILIVVSLVILAGVIVFFAKGKGGKQRPSKKKETKTEVKEEK